MRQQWVGDNKDEWKSHVFTSCRSHGLMGSLSVLPMFTGPWDLPGKKDQYCAILGVALAAIVSHASYSLTNNGYDAGYFASCHKSLSSDPVRPDALFLDPDTGVTGREPPDPWFGRATKSRPRPPKETHVPVRYVLETANIVPNGLVFVFDHTLSRTSDLATHSSSIKQGLSAAGLDSVLWASDTCPGSMIVAGDVTRMAAIRAALANAQRGSFFA
jgi:hypothetical protein